MLEKNKSNKHSDTLEVLIDLIPDPVVVIDRSRKIVATNKAIGKITGYKKEKLIGKSFSDLSFISNEYKKLLEENAKDRLAGSNIPSSEIEVSTENGEVKCLKVSANRFINEGEPLDLAIFHDITEENKIQNELRQGIHESEEKFHGIANSIKEAIIVVDEEARVTYWNPAAEKTFGYTNKEAVGKNIHSLVIPNSIRLEGKERIAMSVKTFTQTGMGYFTVGNVELVGRRKDGSEFPVELSISPTKLMGKWSAVGVVKNISKRKKAEQSLRDAEQRYHTLFNQAPLGVLVVDPETAGFVEFNDISHLQLGYLREEFEKIKIFDIEAKESPAEVRSHMTKMVAEGGGEFETLHRTKSGEIKNILVTTRTFQSAGRTFLHCIYRDITEWKAMEEALRQERDMLENMAVNIDAGLTLVGKDYRIIWANQLLKQVSGSNLENMLCYSVYSRSNEICQDCGVKKIFENGASVDRHDYHFKNNGIDEWVELIVTPVKNKDGKVIAALELAVNITERKRLQTKLAEYSQKLEELVQRRTEQLKKTQAELVKSERLAAIGELAGMVGHDLRNPLTGIKNSAYFMKKKGDEISPSQAHEMLETIDKCVDYSNKIVNDLLDYSKEVRLELREQSPRKLLAESLSLLDLPEKIEVQNKLSDNTTVKIDSDKVKRVFINLIKNAFDAMPNGGKITIDSRQTNGSLEISFSDTGEGIADDVLPKLFSPLFTTKAQGMGFGLAICKRIIEAHGGTIKVKTVKNKGTTFAVTLPIEPKFELGGENTWINIPESS